MSKRVEALTELRNMTTEDLEDHLRRQRRRLFEVRFQQAAGQVENHRQVREIRREIARTMTVQIEIARGFYPALAEETPRAEPEADRPAPRRRFSRAAQPAGDEPVSGGEPELETVAPAAEPEVVVEPVIAAAEVEPETAAAEPETGIAATEPEPVTAEKPPIEKDRTAGVEAKAGDEDK
jgi:large subunit ribosomal protein L29